jgi:energy-coupling factor transport system permease protein
LYVPGSSWAHRADPRLKLLLVVAVWTVLFVYHSLAVFLGALLLLHVVYLSAKIPRRRILAIWKAFLPLGVLIPLLWALFTPGGMVLLELGPLRFSLDGFQQGLLLALRLVSMAFVLLFWLYTTPPDTMVLGLVRLGLPYEWGLTFTLALHYIPAFQDLYRSISDAQQARGLLVSGSGLGRVRAMMPVFVPLVISLLRLSDGLARALEARAFGAAGVHRTYLKEVRFQRSDYGLAALILVVLVGLLVLRFT